MCDLNSTIPFISVCWYKESLSWAFIDGLFTLVSMLLLIYGAFKLLHWTNKIKRLYFIGRSDTIIVFGLGQNNRSYIDSELKYKQRKIIIIEQDKNHLYIDEYMKKASVLVGDAANEQLLKKLNLQNKKHIVVSVGSDIMNLEIVSKIISSAPNSKIYVHIEDRNLRHFHKEGGLLQVSNIRIYSYYEDTSRALFEEHDIDGKSNKIINSDETFSIAIIGNTALAYEVISQACIMGQLPNENKLRIYCIDINPKEFKKSVDLNYTEIDNVPNVSLEYLQLDYNSKEFYTQELWYQNNFTNIVLCYEDEQQNLDIAANLANITYIDYIVDQVLKTKVLVAMFNDYSFSQKLKLNVNIFKNFEVFGQRDEICDRKYLIDEKRDKTAIATNEVYNQSVPENKKKSWQQCSYHEKESNRASADHIKVKQKYMGIDSSNGAKELLVKCEHNRWSTYHYLNGWKYSSVTDKAKKRHDCLLPYNDLTEDIKDYDREMVDNIDKIINWDKNEYNC